MAERVEPISNEVLEELNHLGPTIRRIVADLRATRAERDSLRQQLAEAVVQQSGAVERLRVTQSEDPVIDAEIGAVMAANRRLEKRALEAEARLAEEKKTTVHLLEILNDRA